MKRIALILLLACAVCAGVFAQSEPSYYVSARGNDNNDGLSEDRPLRSLFWAFEKALEGPVKKITVIGTLSHQSESLSEIIGVDTPFAFGLALNIPHQEIIITGKPGVTGTERAVLSARGSGKGVFRVHNANIRFEHIEISGGDGTDNGVGIHLSGGAQVTLGVGAVIRSNTMMGIFIEDGTCVIDGGEVRDNTLCGIMIDDGSLIMRSGSIRNNRSLIGGGVWVDVEIYPPFFNPGEYFI